jgi:hypothetical protein
MSECAQDNTSNVESPGEFLTSSEINDLMEAMKKSISSYERDFNDAGEYNKAIVLKYMPENLKTTEMCLAVVQQYGFALKYVPENFKTMELCMAAVQRNGFALEYVPESFKTMELCMTAVQQNGHLLKYVPDNLKTLEMCIMAVQQDRENLKFVPEIFLKNVNKENYQLFLTPEMIEDAKGVAKELLDL